MSQILIPERSMPLVVLSGLGCYGFSLILIIECGNSKRKPKGSCISGILFISVVERSTFSLLIKITRPSQYLNLLLCLSIQRCEKLKMAEGSHNFQFNVIVVSPGGSIEWIQL